MRVSGSGYNEVLALEVLNVVDCVERRRRAEPPASASAPHAVAAAPSFQACLRGAMCTCCGVGGNCTRQVFCLPVQTSIYTGTGVIDTMFYTHDHTHHGVYICTRVYTFRLFVLSNLITTFVCFIGVFKTCMHGWEGVGGEVLSMVGVCCWH